MEIIRTKDYQDMSKTASEIIINQIKSNPSSVIGFATGETVIGTYKHIISDHRINKTSYKNIHSVNLDEYIGIGPTNPNSYYHFMMDHLFSHIDIKKEHIHIPNGMSDYNEECKVYEKTIAELGGVDLQILGIGENGHIGFNEPNTPFNSKTHVVKLTESTRNVNKRFFENLDDVPTHAITMGIATIMMSKKIILLASNKKKAKIIKQLINSEINEMIPATILKKHQDVSIIADEEALSLI